MHLLQLRKTQVWFQPPTTTVPGNLTISSGLHEHQLYSWCTYIRQNTYKNKKNAPRRQDATFPLYRIQPNYFVMGSYFKQSIIHSNLKRVWTIYHCRKYNKSKLFHGGGLKKRPGTECMGSGWIPLTMLPQRAFYFSQYSTIMTLSWDGLEMSYSTVCWMSCHCQGLENFDHRVRFPCRHKGIEEHDAKMNHSSQSPGREKCCMPSSLASHGIQTPLYYMARYAPKLPL